jgi:hypothetical protein
LGRVRVDVEVISDCKSHIHEQTSFHNVLLAVL